MKIKVGGMFYDLVYEKDLQKNHDVYGSSCGNLLQIKLDDDMIKTIEDTTFVHEIIESINFVYPIKLTHDQILLLETALYQVIKDNKGIFDFKQEVTNVNKE